MRRILLSALLAAALLAMVLGCSSRPSVEPSRPYVAARTTGVVHKSGCASVRRILAANRIGFDDLPTAYAEGYRPCRHCLGHAARAASAAEEETKP